MPGGDRTGPQRGGPMTGRRMGYCAGYDSPGYTRSGVYGGSGRGWGGRGGWGGGRGWRHRYYATGVPGWARADYGGPQPGPVAAGPYPGPQAPAPEQEMRYLQEQADVLQQQLDQIQQRIEEIETQA